MVNLFYLSVVLDELLSNFTPKITWCSLNKDAILPDLNVLCCPGDLHPSLRIMMDTIAAVCKMKNMGRTVQNECRMK